MSKKHSKKFVKKGIDILFINPPLLQYGYFDNDWKKMSGWKTIFVPKTLSKKKLNYYSSYAFKKFYFRPKIIFNYTKKLKSWCHLKLFCGFFRICIFHKIKEAQLVVY